MDELTWFWDEQHNQLNITLPARIDSVTSGELEKQLEVLLEGKEDASICLLAEKLGYISSAGIRIIVSLKKRFRHMEILHVSRLIYDIFSMAGVTNLIPVKKRIRKIDPPEPDRFLSLGEDYELYRMSEEQDVRIYREDISVEEVTERMSLSELAVSLNIPAFPLQEVVVCGERCGILCRHAEGSTLDRIFEERPGDLNEELKKLAELMDLLHHRIMEEETFPDASQRLLQALEEINTLAEKERLALIGLVQSLKEKNTFVLGNLSLKNVLLEDGKLYFLDMKWCGRGNPVLDLQAAASAMHADGHDAAWEQFFSLYIEKKSPEIKNRLKTILNPELHPWWRNATSKEIGRAVLLKNALHFTGIGEENACFFSHLFPERLSPESIRLGVIIQKKAAGAAAGYIRGGLLTLEWFYVDVDFRKQGIGTALFSELKKTATALGGHAIQTEFPKTETELKQFFEKRNAVFAEDGDYFRIPMKRLIESDVFRKLMAKAGKNGNEKYSARPISSLSAQQIRILRSVLTQKGAGEAVLGEGTYDPKLSFVALGEEALVPHGILLSQKKEAELFLHYLANFSGDPLVLLQILSALHAVIPVSEAEKTTVSFVGNRDGVLFAEKLCMNRLKSEGTCCHARVETGEGSIFGTADQNRQLSKLSERAAPEEKSDGICVRPVSALLLSASDRRKRNGMFLQKAQNEETLRTEKATASKRREGAGTGDPASFKKLLQADLSEYEFTDDRSFVTDFAEKYEKLRTFTELDVPLQSLDSGNGHFLQDKDLFELKARIRLSKEMLNAYENKMMIIFSPYYTLLTGRDLERMPVEELEQLIEETKDDEIRNYYTAIRESRMSEFGKKSKTEMILKAYAGQALEDDHAEGFRVLSDFEERFGEPAFSNAIACSKALTNYTEGEAECLCPPLTYTTMRTAAPGISAENSEISNAEVLWINNLTGDLLEGKSVNGMYLSPEIAGEMKCFLEELLKQQRRVEMDHKILELCASFRKKLHPENPGYSGKEKERIRILREGFDRLENDLSPGIQHDLDVFIKKHREFAAFRNDRGFIYSKTGRHWRALDAQKDKLLLNATVNLAGEEKAFPDFYLLGRIKGKAVKPKEGVTKEELNSSWEALQEPLWEAAAYVQYMQANQQLISGMEGYDLKVWYQEKLLEKVAAAANDFLNRVDIE